MWIKISGKSVTQFHALNSTNKSEFIIYYKKKRNNDKNINNSTIF